MWHTKITRINWENKFLFFIEDTRVIFLSSSDLGNLILRFGTHFIKCISLDPHFHICLAQRSRLQSLLSDQFLHFVIVFKGSIFNNQSVKTKLMLHITHDAVHGPSAWFISSLPSLKWTFFAESSFCCHLKLRAVINEGHGFREASFMISCDNGTRWRP